MNMLVAVGLLFVALGLLCGAVLTALPLTALPPDTAVPLAVLALVLMTLGAAFAGAGGRQGANRVMRVLGGGLLLLAVASVLALLAHLIGMVSAPYTWVWWTLLGVGAVGGALLLVMGGDDDTSAPADGKSVPPVRF